MPSTPRTVVDVVDARAAARIVANVAGQEVHEVDAVIDKAVNGSWRAVRSYVRAYQDITTRLLDAFNDVRPDLVVVIDGQHRIADAKGRSSRAAVVVLERASIDAPFSPWIGIAGEGTGVALEVLSRTRELLAGVDPLPLPRGRSALPPW